MECAKALFTESLFINKEKTTLRQADQMFCCERRMKFVLRLKIIRLQTVNYFYKLKSMPRIISKNSIAYNNCIITLNYHNYRPAVTSVDHELGERVKKRKEETFFDSEITR